MSLERGTRWKRARLPRAARWALGTLALLLAFFLLRGPLLMGVARFLEVEDPPHRADLIYLLGGDSHVGARAPHAAALYRRGLAPRVVLARTELTPSVRLGYYPSETDVNLRLLRHFGVPDSAIVVLEMPGGATSTTDEARVLGQYLNGRPTEVIVVTTRYHTRRARWNLRRALRGQPVEIRMSGATDPRFHSGNWWRVEAGLLAYVTEYIKFAHNWLAR